MTDSIRKANTAIHDSTRERSQSDGQQVRRHDNELAMSEKYRVVHYMENGRDIFQDWLDGLRNFQARNAIQKRVDRIEDGSFGEHKPCRSGVWELIIDKGPGYRVYYSLIGDTVVILLCAGDKRTQQKDIDRAIEYLRDFKERNKRNEYSQS